jgi:hypothetical protein
MLLCFQGRQECIGNLKAGTHAHASCNIQLYQHRGELDAASDPEVIGTVDALTVAEDMWPAAHVCS